jgi:hypothetical protein
MSLTSYRVLMCAMGLRRNEEPISTPPNFARASAVNGSTYLLTKPPNTEISI